MSIRSIVRDISYHPNQRVKLFLELPIEKQLIVLKRLSNYVRGELLLQLDQTTLITLLEHLDPDEATDILRTFPTKKRAKLIAEMQEQLQEDINMLLSFEENSAADLMSLNYILVDNNDTISKISEKILTHEKRTGKMPIILVTEEHKLQGYIPGHKFGFAQPKDEAKKHLKPIGTLRYNLNKGQVIDFFTNHPHSKAVILGKNDAVLGVIFSDDVINLLQEQKTSSLYDFAGVSNEESIFDSTKRKVKFRYKWLMLNLATAFLAAFTVSLFEETISRQVLLAVYMPIVAGMGGNAGTQTLVVMVRGLSLNNNLSWQGVFNTLKHEVSAGFINGAIIGLMVFTIVMIFNQNILVGSVLGIAMIVNLIISSTFGTLVPVMMHKLGKDPASSATIFITTATDVFGFLAFLGLATLLLN